MKKAFVLSCLLIIIGFLIGSKLDQNSTASNKYYFLQEGVYDNGEVFEDNISDFKKKVIEYRDNKVIVYIGITKNKEIANKIKKLYHNNNIQIEEVWLENDVFRINIEQLDLLAQKTSSFDEITKIEEVALASYEEILKTRE